MARIKQDAKLAPSMDRFLEILVSRIEQVDAFRRNYGTRKPQGNRAGFLNPELSEAAGCGVFGAELGGYPPARRKPAFRHDFDRILHNLKFNACERLRWRVGRKGQMHPYLQHGQGERRSTVDCFGANRVPTSSGNGACIHSCAESRLPRVLATRLKTRPNRARRSDSSELKRLWASLRCSVRIGMRKQWASCWSLAPRASLSRE